MLDLCSFDRKFDILVSSSAYPSELLRNCLKVTPFDSSIISAIEVLSLNDASEEAGKLYCCEFCKKP